MIQLIYQENCVAKYDNFSENVVQAKFSTFTVIEPVPFICTIYDSVDISKEIAYFLMKHWD